MIMILLAFYKKKKHFSLPNSSAILAIPPNFFLHFLSPIPFFCSKLFFNLKKSSGVPYSRKFDYPRWWDYYILGENS